MKKLMKSLLVLALVVIPAAVALAACGGPSSPSNVSVTSAGILKYESKKSEVGESSVKMYMYEVRIKTGSTYLYAMLTTEPDLVGGEKTVDLTAVAAWYPAEFDLTYTSGEPKGYAGKDPVDLTEGATYTVELRVIELSGKLSDSKPSTSTSGWTKASGSWVNGGAAGEEEEVVEDGEDE